MFYLHAAYFFKETTSPFPSGYLQAKDLEKRIMERKTEVWYRIKQADKFHWVHSDNVIHQKDLWGKVILERDTDISPRPATKNSKKISAGKYPVCGRQNEWVHICGQGWLASPLLQWDQTLESSYAITLRDSHLFRQADLLKPQQMLPARFKVQILKEEKDFYLVKAFNTTAYARKQDLVTVKDFKSHNIYLPSLITNVKDSLLDTKFKNIKGETFVSQVEEQKIEWIKSNVSGHGHVWWTEERKQKQKQATLLDIKDIMSKKVFDIAKHPNKNLTVVSADGVFRSFDGLTWEQLDAFQNKNFAVAFSPTGELYVGDSKSRDLGQKFERFVRWDQVIRDLNIKTDTHDFSIQEIRFDGAALILHVKKKTSDFYIASKDHGKSWYPYQDSRKNIIDNL